MSSHEFDGREIANFVLDYCEKRGISVSNLSLQKIIYFCHVWSLIELGRPLIKQKFEAWKHGPVLQYVYREFQVFEAEPISSRATKLNPRTGESLVANGEFDAEIRALLDRVVSFYGRLSSTQLVDLSHVEGGPWEKVWNHDGNANPGMKIEDEAIVDFYSRASRPFSVQ